MIHISSGGTMENQNMWLSSVYLVKDVVLHPREVFRKTNNGETQKEVLIVFGVAALISLLKSFSTNRHYFNFFADERLNQLLSILSVPQLEWLVAYILYFAMICFVFGICRLFSKTGNLKSLILVLMSISSIGIASQIISYPIHFILPKNVIFIGSYCVYIWVIVLSIKAIQLTQGLTLLKAVLSFLPPVIVFIGIGAFTVVAPYLKWITV
jgi:hypothetical protein